MPPVHIVTDSSAVFNSPRTVPQYPVTVVPNRINLGGKLYRDGIDLTTEEMLKILAGRTTPPEILPPTVEDYAAVFARLAPQSAGIISIHASRELSPSWHNGRLAAQQLGGTCAIAVIDSRTLCAGQGMLVRLAWQALLAGSDFDSTVNQVRSAVDRIYALYYTESLPFLWHHRLLAESRMLLAAMLNIKPVISIEDGRLLVTEKVRTRSQAVERLVEFVAEFEHLEEVVIIQNRPHITEQTRILQDRFAIEFPGRHFPYLACGVALAAWIGIEAAGVVILEKEMDAEAYDDD
ncbi:MAG: DegV family EDD domain-containing protein [Anaerolineae bacterium]|jgi:DegV family protein with EDD domain|nr:DegV family EDD domain-containing protein [Anaerolineae bacterium]